MASTLVLWLVFPAIMKTETLVYGTAPDIVECTDASTPCVITCAATTTCRQTEFHCHRTAPQPCTIHIDGTSVGRDSFYYTHQAPIVTITINEWYAMYNSVIYAHEAMKSKLYISSTGGGRLLSGTTIYAPVGEGSLLDITCVGGDGCRGMKIYDDWTTEVHIEAESMMSTQIRNIFADSPLNISRNDTIYTGLNSAYRAPVYLKNYNSDSTQSFVDFKYFGHNHGDWTLYGSTRHCFHGAYIEATADIPPYKNRSSGYDINLIGTSAWDNIFSLFTLNANQFGANIYVEVTGDSGLSSAEIYAEKANSVEVYCKEGGDCDGLMVECPLHNACKIQCDDDVNTDCSNMKIYTNDMCSHADVLCDGIRCNFGVDSTDTTKIFCGFAQNETFCSVEYNASQHLFCQNNGSAHCNNEHTEAHCGESTITPTEISSTDSIWSSTIELTLKEGRVNEETTKATEAPETSQKKEIIVVTENERLLFAAAAVGLCLCMIIIVLVCYVVHLRKKREEVHVNQENMKDDKAISVVATGEEEKKSQNMNVPMVAMNVDVYNMPLPQEHRDDDEEEEDDDEGLWEENTGNNMEEKTVGKTTKDN